MSIAPPTILETTQNKIFERLKEMAPHFTPEWSAPAEDPGTALVKIFSFLTQETVDRLKQSPKRNMLAFLDLLGIRLAPKTPAGAFLRFQVSDGAPGPIDIPARTLVTAAAEAGELPFETDEPIRANPGKVAGLFAVDPEHDAIYRPPRGFLEKERVEPPWPNYKTTAFSAAGFQSIQLQLVDGIESGDTLRINGKDFVVSEKKGLIVQLIQPLTADVNDETPVSKRTTFELFNGINLQEHILYLSHPEYFNLKEEAVIALEVAAAQTGDSAEIAWEFFTENPATKLPWWAPLTVNRDDTGGLSRDGSIELLKPVGEIKEANIGGQDGRWIRARRKTPIALLDRLSNLDSVTIRVSTRASFSADAAFYNDSPLPVTASQFNPLGFEPQLFDRFQIASREGFSKVGANVFLDFRLDLTRLLGGPVAVLTPSSIFRVFARGVLTRLTEVAFSPLDQFIDRTGAPTATAAGAVPTAVALAGSDRTGVFVRCEDHAIRLFKSSSLDSQEGWIELDKPGGSEVFLDPAAVAIPGRSQWVVFTVADGKIWHKTTSPVAGAGQAWRAVDALAFKPSSAPAVALDAAQNPVLFVFDDQDRLWRVRFTWSTLIHDWEGQPGQLLPNAALANQDVYKCKSAASAHPFAVDGFTGSADPAVFFLNKADGITGVRSPTENQDLGVPDSALPGAADPSCVLQLDNNGNPDHLLVFAAFGSEGQLYSAEASTNLGSRGDWRPHSNPQPVAGRPFALPVFRTQYRLFATSGQGSMLQLAVRTETGVVIEADSKKLLLLNQNMPRTNLHPRFARINPAFVTEQPRALVEPFPGPAVALFAIGVNPALAKAAPYQLFELLQAVTTDGESTAASIKLLPHTVIDMGPGLWLSVETVPPQFVQIDGITVAGDSVNVHDPLANVPGNGIACKIFRLLSEGSTAESVTNRVLLDAYAQPYSHAYDGADIEIGNAITPVKSYDAPNRIVELESAIGVNGDTYKFPEQWRQIQDPALDDINPVLSWEYWNGSGWVTLKLGWPNDPVTGQAFVKDETEDLISSGHVRFVVPSDIALTEVAGQTNYWIRARLVGGNYGQVKFETKSITSGGETTYTAERKDFSRPPIVTDLKIGYSVETEQPPKILQTLNNLDIVDQTAANTTPGKSFQPFVRLDKAEKSIYLGFEQRISSGSILVTLRKELPLDDNRKLIWEALFQNQFREIDVKDETGAFTRAGGLLQVNVPFEAERRQLLGLPAYWSRARLLQQDWPESPELTGVFLNAAKAKQLRTYLGEILGPSDGTPNQRFLFHNKPVLEEIIRIRTTLTEEERKRIKAEDGEDAVLDVLDESGQALETWVQWKEVPEFFASTFDSRHYRLDRATGELEFGDGRHGAVPPVGGDNIRAFSYRSGGGDVGNVDADTIKSLVTAIGGIDLVSNPLPAGGGSEEATRDQMLDLGPAELNHRGRAVSCTDYEWLTLHASREVVKARCVPNRDDGGLYNPGWVSIYIVASSKDAHPKPSLELCRRVREELLKSAPAVVASSGHIFVGRPQYVPVSVRIKVAAPSIGGATEAERSTRRALDQFLHPLDGGLECKGWEFGQGLAISQLYAAIEALPEVDHVDELSITPAANSDDYLRLKPDQILASGNHDITVTVAKEAQAWR